MTTKQRPRLFAELHPMWGVMWAHQRLDYQLALAVWQGDEPLSDYVMCLEVARDILCEDFGIHPVTVEKIRHYDIRTDKPRKDQGQCTE